MSYTNGAVFEGTLIRKSNAMDTALSLVGSTGNYASYLVTKQCKVQAMMFYVSTLTANNLVAAKVELKRRPTYNSTSGAVSIGIMTIPTATAAGKVVYKVLSEAGATITLMPGDELSLELNTAGTDSGSAAGAGFFGFQLDDDPEDPRNQSNMVAGA